MATQIDIFTKSFANAAIKVLETQGGLKAELKSQAKPGEVELQPVDIAGVIGLVSSVYLGNITLCMPKAVFLAIMSNMFGEEMTELNDELADGASELMNMVFGQAKIPLNDDHAFGIQKAIPTVIKGDNLTTNQPTSGEVLNQVFSTPAGEFYLQLAIEEAQAEAAA